MSLSNNLQAWTVDIAIIHGYIRILLYSNLYCHLEKFPDIIMLWAKAIQATSQTESEQATPVME